MGDKKVIVSVIVGILILGTSGLYQDVFAEVVYQNGDPDPNRNGIGLNGFIIADDFILEEDSLITDFHFIYRVTSEPFVFDGPFQYEIRQNDGGLPGSVIVSGESQNLEIEQIEDASIPIPDGWPRFLGSFDLEESILLSSGVTYWVTLSVDSSSPFVGWDNSDIFQTGFRARGDFGSGTWSSLPGDLWFQLTDSPLDRPIGGTVGSLDTTSLLVAGAQSNMGLWSLALVGAVAAGAAITYKLKSKKTEQ